MQHRIVHASCCALHASVWPQTVRRAPGLHRAVLLQEPLSVSRSLNVSEAGSPPPVHLPEVRPGLENSGPDEAMDFRVQQLREIIVALAGEKAALLQELHSGNSRAEDAEAKLQAVTDECSRWSDEVCSSSITPCPMLSQDYMLYKVQSPGTRLSNVSAGLARDRRLHFAGTASAKCHEECSRLKR